MIPSPQLETRRVLADPWDYFTREPVAVSDAQAEWNGASRTVQVHSFLNGPQHYSSSFGKQWTKYRNVQIDRFNGTKASLRHLLSFAHGDLSVFKGTTCLEIGSGAGRFTDYLVTLAETVITVDPSPAILVNAALGAPNLIPCRADLFDVPVKRESIDIVFCRGVIQHTNNPARAIKQLFEYVKPGGLVLFDVYPLKWYTPLVTKYWLRPFTRRVDAERFTAWAERNVPRLFRFKSRVVNRLLPNNIVGVNLSNQLIPIADFSRSAEPLTPEQQAEWSLLDTVDMYTPRYDRPMTFNAIIRAIEGAGAQVIEANRSTFCFKARAAEVGY